MGPGASLRGSRLRVLVAGAGIGGLTAALALREAGHEVVVFDRQPTASRLAVGGGMHLWPNGMRGLRAVGLAERVRALGGDAAVVRRSEFWSWRPRRLGGFDVSEIERRLGEPTVGVSRAELHPLLLDALPADALRLGRAVTGFSQDDRGVVAHLEDGEEPGDVLVGADGLRSVVRDQLLGAKPPRFAGYASWQAFTDDVEGAPPGTLRVMFGPGTRFLHYPVGAGRLYWEAIAVTEPGLDDPAGQRRDGLLDRFRGWPGFVRTVLSSTPEEAIVRADIYDRPPVKRWGEGRVTLLGDAAHPMTNAVAQGANMAIEDAIVLRRALDTDHGAANALRAYERERLPRTTSMVRLATMLASLARWRHPLAVRAREAVLGGVAFSAIGFRQQLRDLDFEV